MLEAASEVSFDPVYPALLAYLNTFRVGEHWETYDDGVIEETRRLVDSVLAANPFNGLTLALAGHACGYTLHDYALADELLDRAMEINPNLAFGWDHRALGHMYCGRLEEARHASELAVRIGRFSPLRFTYDTTLCMIATLSGDYATAVRLGEQALARRPNFGAALRYTAVSLGHLGRREDAERLVARIRSMAPDFSHDWVVRNRLAVANESAKSCLLIGLQKAGA